MRTTCSIVGVRYVGLHRNTNKFLQFGQKVLKFKKNGEKKSKEKNIDDFKGQHMSCGPFVCRFYLIIFFFIFYVFYVFLLVFVCRVSCVL